MTEHDAVQHPSHYVSHPSGVECITVTEHMGFCLGNAVKYIWRADLKHDAIEDLRKAAWYIEREIGRRALSGAGEQDLSFSPGEEVLYADGVAEAVQQLRDEVRVQQNDDWWAHG